MRGAASMRLTLARLAAGLALLAVLAAAGSLVVACAYGGAVLPAGDAPGPQRQRRCIRRPGWPRRRLSPLPQCHTLAGRREPPELGRLPAARAAGRGRVLGARGHCGHRAGVPGWDRLVRYR